MSAWPALDPAIARQAAAEAQDDVWRADRLKQVTRIIYDRALTPAAQHALIELLLDPVEDKVIAVDDDHLAWSGKLSCRLGITPRSACKALSELEAAGLVRRQGKALDFLPIGWAERMRLGTDAPRLRQAQDLDTAEAHAQRLERLRDYALGEGRYTTALAAQRTIGGALSLDAGPAAEPEEEEAPSPPEPAPLPEPPARNGCAATDIMPTVRDTIQNCPDGAQITLATLAETRAEEVAARAAGPPSPFETQPTAAPQDEGCLEGISPAPHPEERPGGERLEE